MITILIINALYCIGLHNATQDGFILSAIRRVKLPKYIANPLYDCIYCMASIWSIPFAIWGGWEWFEWLFYVPALSAMNGITYGIFDHITSTNE